MSMSKVVAAVLVAVALPVAIATTTSAEVRDRVAVLSARLDCVAVGVTTYADGSVWAVQDCNGVRLSIRMDV